MKVILPVAGKGERMRPYTNELPKCLLPVGGKTIIDWIVEDALKLNPSETIFITGYKAEKMDQYLESKPNWGKTRAILQSDPQGLGQAISLALPDVNDEPLIIILGDTLFDADLSILNPVRHSERSEESSNVLFTYKVADPRRFGVAVTDTNGNIQRLVEKPQEFVSNEAIVGIYYIKDVKALKTALQHLMDNDIRTKGEFQLTDALQMMIEQGCKFRTAPVKEWLDCGLPETLIETNTWLLNNRLSGTIDQNTAELNNHNAIIPPCHIGKNCRIENSTIGPNVTIGDNCILKDAIIKDCVVWNNVERNSINCENQIIANV
ncbi:sugar phosphate nucleotidyltransferase [Fibrobacter sp. UWH1]|uniref:sugar phosphate nucleotidyltransferase n=1 Tax=Fibrobacter sp. UWH1 TaxID=1964354 RepID=UPI000B52032B|nr:sugar phosphate nucleotidyltransferase [Fibrobacter sp. UWH1]OWV04212.1 nucleotidyl transferase [Fibrobacter sp. UWH1]